VTELKDKAPAYSALDPAVMRLSGALDESRAPRPSPTRCRRWSISAMASRRRRLAVAAATQAAGEGADAAKLIRSALKEIAK